MLLVDLPSNPDKRMLVEVGIIVGIAVTIYAIHCLIYSIIVQTIPSSWVVILSLVTITMFVVSYVACRLTVGLGKTQGRWSNRSSKITAFTTVFMVGLVLVIAAYPYLTEPSQSQGHSSDGDVPEEHVGSSPAVQSRNSLVIRSETTGDVWVIEAERKDSGWEVGVGRDTAYLAAATIIGLVTFGSLVSIRAVGNPKTNEPRQQGFVMMCIGMTTVLGFQSIIMHSACCGSMNMKLFDAFFWATVVALVFTAFGFARVIDSWFKDPSKPQE